MAKFTANHDRLYFDVTCRTKKSETVLSLIHATYQAKLNCKEGDDVKKEIAKRLENAYNLFKWDARSYSGDSKQFESQYTIGHELCIWKNSELDLTDLAVQVAENRMTIREYFDIVFLNYIQPVNGNVVHVLYHLLSYMKKTEKLTITKDDMATAYMEAGKTDEKGEINGAYNMLIASSYFVADSSGKELVYSGKCSVDELISRCNIKYVEKGYEVAVQELKAESDYISYLLEDHRVKGITMDDMRAYTEEELACELNQLYKLYGTVGIHLFGVRRGSYIKSKKINLYNVCAAAKISKNYYQEITKGMRLAKYVSEKETYDNSFDAVSYQEMSDDIKTHITCSEFIEGGYNAIYYGTPGCGKSYHIENELLKNVDEKYKFRTTFYLDYTHTDFVGQLMPVVKKENKIDGTETEIVSYQFVPGPFTLALETAYANPKTMVYLVIEEINRGNAASILGDIFQLLDREKPGNKKNRPFGQSEYAIDKVDVVNYLTNEKNFELPNNKMFIPSNLCLIGTMNTNDQNVSSLDTAFKRRWKMVKIKNDFSDDHPYSNSYIPGTDVSWRQFVETVNDRIVSDVSIGVNAEDKQLGPFFLDATDLTIEAMSKDVNKQRSFAYKVLEYLWSNVAKYERGNWFKGNPKTLDDLVDSYIDKGMDIFEGDIFTNGSEEDVQMYSDNGEEE